MTTPTFVYMVFYSLEDKEYVGVCPQFAYLSFLDKDPTKALEGIMQLVIDSIADEEPENES